MNAIESAAQETTVDRPLRLLIVEDQPVIRRGLALVLGSEPDIQVVAEAADGEEAVRVAAACNPDVVVMDLQMPRKSGVAATREIRAARPDTRVVVLTTYDDDDLVFDALRAGAQAYLLKDASESEIRETIHAVHRGESHLSPSIARKLIDQFRSIAAHPAGATEPDGHATEAPDGSKAGQTTASPSPSPSPSPAVAVVAPRPGSAVDHQGATGA